MMAPAMTQQSVTFQQVTVSGAAGILGVSTQTVRRMIRRGQLEGERVHRPQGSAYVVRLPVDVAADDTDATPTQQPAPSASRANATAAPELMAMWSQTFLAPIMARMAEQEATIRELERENGGQAAELEALRARNDALTASTATRGQEASTGGEPSETGRFLSPSGRLRRMTCGRGGGAGWVRSMGD
jgi:hypothetical protein